MISLPILCLYDIKKFPRQYLETEKLRMLNDGIEIVTTSFLSVKVGYIYVVITALSYYESIL